MSRGVVCLVRLLVCLNVSVNGFYVKELFLERRGRRKGKGGRNWGCDGFKRCWDDVCVYLRVQLVIRLDFG